MQDKNMPLHFDLSEIVLKCCFDIMNELGSGFLESVYKNALFVAIAERKIFVETEKRFEVFFRGSKIGLYVADLIVDGNIIIEIKIPAASCGVFLLPISFS